jgi:hypothetical protein
MNSECKFCADNEMAGFPDHLNGAAVSGYHTEGTALSESELDGLAEKLSLVWASRHE